jgi:hypothetical protein
MARQKRDSEAIGQMRQNIERRLADAAGSTKHGYVLDDVWNSIPLIFCQLIFDSRHQGFQITMIGS